MTKIKMCGMFSNQDICYANKIMPDYIGFVFASFSHRAVTPQKAEELSKMLDKRIKPVGVFVNHKKEFILELLEKNIISAVQLHGNEDETFITELKNHTNADIIKAFKVTNQDDIKKACLSCADYILLDNKIPGSGEKFNWELLNTVDRPYFLAGGLNNDNIDYALKLKPFAVDVSSGIETDKTKDYNKMKLFAEKVRANDKR